jgi:flavin-dependent dehydrogenase
MDLLPTYDVAIIGGGLAGLAASILMRRKGYSVILFEKETYPFHRVCGEYVSLESKGFLKSLGLPLDDWMLPHVDTLQLTAPNGKLFAAALPLGGFGISRYKLDHELAAIAKQTGVHLLESTKVEAVERGEGFKISFRRQAVSATLCFASYGKRSNLDVKWNRSFLTQQDNRLNNYVGVKYHIRSSWPQNVIGLHNFENGYCGISRIENESYCLCYMTKAENLKRSGNSITAMQEAVLFQNPHLKQIFKTSEVLQEFPVTISQISFSQKPKVENGVLMLGDSAGMITPLCGNGMSIALHTAKIASTLGAQFLQGELTQNSLEKTYQEQWSKHFASRLRTGRLLQSFFGSKGLSNFFVSTFLRAPFLAGPVIRQTHGEPF